MQAFRSARFIGATVVSAARRLPRIRAAQPFAVIVEEACEVMEPTLVAVLAVESLKKLEMIGDHRQLPAFVQQTWYNLQMTTPSIKISLFERLISGSSGSGKGGMLHSKREIGEKEGAAGAVSESVPCTILDEQRRMRSAICNLSRDDYADIVNIIDHGISIFYFFLFLIQIMQ